MYQPMMPGVKGSEAGLLGLINMLLCHRAQFDFVVFSGRTGAVLATLLHMKQRSLDAAESIPSCVVRSADSWRCALEQSTSDECYSQTVEAFYQDRKRLMRSAPEVGALIESLFYESLAQDYRKWRLQCEYRDGGELTCPAPHVRGLFVDDTVTCTHVGTYAWVRKVLEAFGAQCLGYIAGYEDFDNGMEGFHLDSTWCNRFEALRAYETSPQRFRYWLTQRYSGSLTSVDPYILELLE